MGGRKDRDWFMQLDFDWASDAKIVNLRAKYGKAILVDVINTFVLMAKCDGIADMNNPAHVEWARQYIGKKGKALTALFDRLAEFEIISSEAWSAFRHVSSSRAVSDAERRRETKEKNRKRTEKARAAKLEKSRASSVTEHVTE